MQKAPHQHARVLCRRGNNHSLFCVDGRFTCSRCPRTLDLPKKQQVKMMTMTVTMTTMTMARRLPWHQRQLQRPRVRGQKSQDPASRDRSAPKALVKPGTRKRKNKVAAGECRCSCIVLLVGGLGRSMWARGRRLRLQWLWQAAKSGPDQQGTLTIVHEQGSELGI